MKSQELQADALEKVGVVVGEPANAIHARIEMLLLRCVQNLLKVDERISPNRKPIRTADIVGT
jgi:hypothetical protein